MDKSDSAYKTIGEVAKELNLIDKKTGILQTHTIRYWEKCFKQVKPILRAGKRRYYSAKDLKLLTQIKFLLKEKGFTISGVKKILNDNKSVLLDGNTNLGLYKPNLKSNKLIKEKILNISKIINELKKIKNG